MIAVEAPGRQGATKAQLLVCYRGATKPAGMHRPRRRSTYPLAGP